MLGVFYNDNNYQLHQRSAERNGSDKPLAVLNQLCNHLYDRIHSRIPQGKMAVASMERKTEIGIRMLQEQYQQENEENGRVCPVCVRELLFGMGESEADHYFPRGKYPALALHSCNIIPTCSDCNATRLKYKKLH